MQKNQNILWQIESECEKWDFKPVKTFDLKTKIRQSGFYNEALNSKHLDGFWIKEEIGNNSFVFQKGKKVFVPPLVFSEDNYSLKKGKNIVFSDLDETGRLISSLGLENFILTQGKKTGLPIYVIDNHNWAFYAWAEAKFLNLFSVFFNQNTSFSLPREGDTFFSLPREGDTSFSVPPRRDTEGVKPQIKKISPLPLLIHIDAHKDEGEAELITNFKLHDIESVVEQTKNLKVSNYIAVAIQLGLIQKEFFSLTASKDFADYAKQFDLLKQKSQNIILNVDLDIFDPAVSLISLEEKVKAIGYFAKKADLITFATSPGFIDQDLAIEILKVMWEYL